MSPTVLTLRFEWHMLSVASEDIKTSCKNMPKKKLNKDEKRWLSSPKLDGVSWVYANDWWDYVLTGVVMYQGKRYYAYCGDENHYGERKNRKWWRRYVVVDMTDEAWAEEDERHSFFKDKVGSHFDFVECPKTGRQVRNHAGLKNQKTWQEFYDRYPSNETEKVDPKTFPVVGWFEVQGR